MSFRAAIADRLARIAAHRLRPRHPDWADAVLAEQRSLDGRSNELGWAMGALRASFAAATPDLVYPLMLTLAVAGLTVHQWNVDEGADTVLLLAGAGLGLGLARPRHFLLSGLVVGAVVAAVNGFEALSGIRPAYEIYPRTLAHSLHWLVLVAPALLASAAGREIGRNFRT